MQYMAEKMIVTEEKEILDQVSISVCVYINIMYIQKGSWYLEDRISETLNQKVKYPFGSGRVISPKNQPAATAVTLIDASLSPQMIPLTLTAPSSSSSPLCFRLSQLPTFKSSRTCHLQGKLLQRKLRNGTCRAEFSIDAPVGLAIGACILSSLVFPITSTPNDDEGGSVIDSDDARFAVMGIISFIPYFNWLSWLFAWLDTGERRYAVYALVYLAPYLRPNLSISPEDSWLPIASILLCIIHIQLEASIQNGDIQGLQLFREVGRHISSVARKSIGNFEKKEEDEEN